MIDFFNSLYACINGKNSFLAKLRVYSLCRFGIRQTANFILPLYFKLTSDTVKHSLPLSDKKSQLRIIVTLTSFPLRISKLWIVIESILRQSYKPDKIILWLSKEQFSSLDCLPKILLDQRKRGLDIRLVDGDLRSHKKYYYAFQEFPNDIIVTVDDDIIYRKSLIETLYKNHLINNSSIICMYAYEMQFDSFGTILPYKKWFTANRLTHRNLFFGSGGGTLFPPEVLYTDVTNINLALKLCPLADDVWLNAMVQINKTPVFKVCDNNSILPVVNANDVTLASENQSRNRNDIQIQNIVEFYRNFNWVFRKQ